MLTGLGERLRRVRKTLGLTQREMAAMVGASLRTWQDWEAEKTAPNGRVFAFLVRKGFDSNWILTGKGTMRFADNGAGLAAVTPPGWKMLDKRYADAFAGDWQGVPHYGDAGDSGESSLAFAPNRLPLKVDGNPEHLATYEMGCDAMSPSLDAGDVVVFDTSVQRVDKAGTYVLSHTGKTVVRRAEPLPGGGMSISTSGDDGSPEIVDEGQIEVRGKVLMRIKPCED